MIWPNQAKSAFNLGFDLDGETIWRNKARRLPGGDSFLKGPSIGGYGPRKGAYRILEILKEFDLKATWFIPAVMIEAVSYTHLEIQGLTCKITFDPETHLVYREVPICQIENGGFKTIGRFTPSMQK